MINYEISILRHHINVFILFTDLIKGVKHQGFANPFTTSLTVYHEILNSGLDKLKYLKSYFVFPLWKQTLVPVGMENTTRLKEPTILPSNLAM